MAHEIIMPALGMAQETGRLVAWLKNEGDTVKKGEPLMEVETDKSTMEVEAPKDGFLVNISAAENTDIPVGEVVALIVENLGDISSKTLQDSSKTIQNNEEKAQINPNISTASNKEETFSNSSAPSVSSNKEITKPSLTTEGKILASPKLRSLAAKEQLSLKKLRQAGHKEPFKVADLPALRQLSSQSNMVLRSNATSLIDKSSYMIFLSEINSAAELEITSEKVFASFISASLRLLFNEENIGIHYKSGLELQSTFYQDPDKYQLENIIPHDADMQTTAEVCDLTSTDLIQLSGEINSDIIFTISNFSEQFLISLDWHPNRISQENALVVLRDVSSRIKSPLKQLL